MISAILGFIGIKKWLLIGGAIGTLVVALAFMWVLHQRDVARNELLEVQGHYELALEVNRRNAATYQRLQEQLQKSRVAAETELIRQREDNERLENAIKAVLALRDDRTVGPVLSHTLEWLRQERARIGSPPRE